MDVGVRELKQKLSAYLERVARGETIRVTDRGRVKAVLAPPSAAIDLAAAVSEGWVKPASKTRRAAVVPATSENTITDTLNDDRSS